MSRGSLLVGRIESGDDTTGQVLKGVAKVLRRVDLLKGCLQFLKQLRLLRDSIGRQLTERGQMQP